MSKVEELRDHVVEEVVSDINELASAWGWNEHLTEMKMNRMTAEVDSLIAAARAEGVAAERERIRNESELEECDDSVMAHFADYYRVPRETLDGRAYDELGNPCEPFFPPPSSPRTRRTRND